MSESYWNSVKTGAKILYAYGDTSSPNSRNPQEKSVSIWQDEPTNEEKLANLQAKKERCDSKWNAFKNFFGFGEKMTSREIDTYYKLDVKERQRQAFEHMRKEDKDFYQEFMSERAGRWE